MKYIKFIFPLIAILLVNCDDDFLNTIPTDRIAVDQFWSQEQDGILTTNACYRGLNLFNMFHFEGCSDNGCTSQTWREAYMVANGSFNSSWGWINTVWSDAYTYIRQTNDVIAHVDDIPGMDQELKNRLKGEALTIRAYLYNILTFLYGDVPYFREPVTLIEEGKAPRESKDKIINDMIADLDMAAGYLPVRYTLSADQGRITRGTAYAVKARLCLHHGKYQQARDAAAEIMKEDIYPYRLYSDYTEIFTYENQMNSEVILDIQYMPDLRVHNSFEFYGPRSAQGTSNHIPTRSLIDEYETGDPRLRASILMPLDPHPYISGIFDPTPGSGTVDECGVSYYATCTGYQYRKYVLIEDARFPARCNINLIMIRYADVLLMFAEAENELNGPTQAAYDAINAVRKRARGDDEGIIPDLSGLTKEQFLDAVLKERRVEFAGEGLRYFDILRRKLAEDVLNGTVYGMDYIDEDGTQKTVVVETRVFDRNKNYLWPIPEAQLRLNPHLAGNQNPGY